MREREGEYTTITFSREMLFQPGEVLETAGERIVVVDGGPFTLTTRPFHWTDYPRWWRLRITRWLTTLLTRFPNA